MRRILENGNKMIEPITGEDENIDINTDINTYTNEKKTTFFETQKKLDNIKIELKYKDELVKEFEKYCNNFYNSENIINELKNDLQNDLRKKEKFEGSELNELYYKYVGILDNKINEEKKKFEEQINIYLEDEKKYLKDNLLTGNYDKKIKDEIENIINEIYISTENIGITFINNYQYSNIETQISLFPKERIEKETEEELNNPLSNIIETNLNVSSDNKYLLQIKDILRYNTLGTIEKYVNYINKLKKGGSNKEIEKLWDEVQERIYKYQIGNKFLRIKYDISKIYGAMIQNKINKIINEISVKKDHINIINKYIKKYGIFMFARKGNLYDTIEKLVFKISEIEDIKYKQKKINNPKINEDINENDEKFLGLEKQISLILKKTEGLLNGEQKNKLKDELIKIYKTGIKTDNPVLFWNDYTIVKKYEIKQPISNHKNKNSMIDALKNALEIKRIEFMQNDLKNKSHSEFVELKDIITKKYKIKIGKNKENDFNKEKQIIIKLKELYGINDITDEYVVDYEKEYGKLIDSIIDKQILKDRLENRKYGIINIFGNRKNLKSILYRIISRESMGNIFISNNGLNSSALGILQKLKINYDNFQINPFNVRESIESFFISIVQGFNNIVSKNKLNFKNNEYIKKIKIAILIHFLGESGAENVIKGNNKKGEEIFDILGLGNDSKIDEKVKLNMDLGIIKKIKI